MIQSKVVSLQPDRLQPEPVPAIVNTVRQHARRHLLGLLNKLLDCTDDALFEMADKSQNNIDHNLYFDSMRQIRLHRADIQKQFLEQLNEAFDDIFQAPANGASADDAGAGEMQMLDNDDLEISVAISGIVSKITSQFSLPIMELTKRLDHLAKHTTVRERCNPLGPQRLSEAFAAAIACLSIDIRIRIILLKLFERTVMQQMGAVYDDTNLMLAQAGVLKDLRATLNRGRGAQPLPPQRESPKGAAGEAAAATTGTAFARSAPGAAAGYGPGVTPGYGSGLASSAGANSIAGGSADFGLIQTLLAGMRGSGGVAPDPGTIVATAQLLNALNAAQTEASQEPLELEHFPKPVDVRQFVVARASSQSGKAFNQLSRSDEDVVDFIGMLFDYILNDRNLAIPMKALIARLQIPVVKLAIIDKTFFERSSHPARQLLNELSSAGIGWSSASELKRDAVYDKVESVVVRVLNEFNENPEIFPQLLEELREFRSRDAARNGRLEQRIRENESGKARTLAAKQEVQQVINQKASGLRLPRDLGRFLSEVWSRVLVYSLLTEGGESAGWLELIATLDDLLWSMQPLDQLDEVERRDRNRSSLLQQLATGMESIQLPANDKSQWLDLIASQLEDISASDRRFLEGGTAALAAVAEDRPALEEIVLTEVADPAEAFTGPAPQAKFVEKIGTLAEGAWLEFLQEDNGTPLRCKLTTIIEPGNRYIFVNRRGMKVAERTRLALARELEDGKVVILNDTQVFDRALQAVIGNLRKVQNQSR